MLRSRSSNYFYAFSKEDRSRILPLTFSALDFLVFSPDNLFIFTGAFTTDIQTFTLSNVKEPLTFRYTSLSSVAGVTIYWKKNNGSYIAWPSNTPTSSTFSSNDQLTVAISTGRNTGFLTITLIESLTNSICSNLLSIEVLEE